MATQQQKAEALAANPKYSKVSRLKLEEYTHPPRCLHVLVASHSPGFVSRCFDVQIRDLNAGTFGFVELALDKSTGQQVAIKFIERGDKVSSERCSRRFWQNLLHLPSQKRC